MKSLTKRTVATVAAVSCLGGAGWAFAAGSGASGSSASTAVTQSQTLTATPAAQTQQTPQGQPPAVPGGQHPGETLLTGDNAAKAKAAALAKVPGATVDRVETDADGGGVYEAHITKADGSRATVLMDKDFAVTSVLDR